jgi:hypothetical protein
LAIAAVALAGCDVGTPSIPIGSPEILCEESAAHVLPTSATPGTEVTVTGDGWAPCELDSMPDALTIEWVGIEESAIQIAVDGGGGFTTSLTVPTAGPGSATNRVSTSINVPVDLAFTIMD